MNNKKHSNGGKMPNPLINDNFENITLTADPRGNYVTWAVGKKQVRAAIKASSFTAVGLFRMRKENKNEFSIQARDPNGVLYTVTAARKPGAVVEATPLLNS